jgi:hypothetical protein
LLLAVDISGSMGTEDMTLGGSAVTRLAAVKHVVGDFVERRRGDRLGLILFGSQAYLQAPLTFDRITVNALLTETPLGIAGGKTAIGDAIGLAVKRLLNRPAENRVLILLTDGVNNVGEVSPLQAAQLAAQEGITIYTIGFGADQMEVKGLLFDRTVNPSAELDTQTLTDIAALTGGVYQRARSTEELAGIYEALDRLEPIEVDQETFDLRNPCIFGPWELRLCSAWSQLAFGYFATKEPPSIHSMRPGHESSFRLSFYSALVVVGAACCDPRRIFTLSTSLSCFFLEIGDRSGSCSSIAGTTETAPNDEPHPLARAHLDHQHPRFGRPDLAESAATHP